MQNFAPSVSQACASIKCPLASSELLGQTEWRGRGIFPSRSVERCCEKYHSVLRENTASCTISDLQKQHSTRKGNTEAEKQGRRFTPSQNARNFSPLPLVRSLNYPDTRVNTSRSREAAVPVWGKVTSEVGKCGQVPGAAAVERFIDVREIQQRRVVLGVGFQFEGSDATRGWGSKGDDELVLVPKTLYFVGFKSLRTKNVCGNR